METTKEKTAKKSVAKTASKAPSKTRSTAKTKQSLSKSTRDHAEIQSWIEKRGGTPSMVKGTEDDKNNTGILRVDFPGYSGKDTLMEISWDDFFKKFDDSNLEFLYQEKTSTGKESRFNKFVSQK